MRFSTVRYFARLPLRIYGMPASIIDVTSHMILCELRLVLDTDVVVAAMRNPSGASAALLRAARQGRLAILLSVALALEFEAVCNQAEQRLASGLCDHEAEIFVTAVIAMAEPVRIHFLETAASRCRR